MPKFPTFPTLFDDCKTISISDLKRWKYLEPNTWQNGTITWSRNGNRTGRISITINTYKENPYIELDYKCNGNPINYRVQLITITSNLGRGVIWFFVCPATGMYCRKLYLVDTYFYHRTAFRGCMYEKQTQSHYSRNLGKQFDRFFGSDKAYELIYSKHFKKKYGGKFTKRYLKLLRRIEAG
ncbi:MAG TPA: hypothetical protein VGQ59_21995 [Cyclobacteriaceae bacterium]|jgi:hypothetical protein|nr:hypothetical protein [Cyclobacteriaceae bacterium]